MAVGRDGRCAPPNAALPLLGSNRVRKPIPHSAGKQKGPARGPFHFLAERAGFEPAVRYKRTLAFQASALSRSATSPNFKNPTP